jgi:hypothetical protein
MAGTIVVDGVSRRRTIQVTLLRGARPVAPRLGSGGLAVPAGRCEQTKRARVCDGLRSAVRVELGVDVAHMSLDRVG